MTNIFTLDKFDEFSEKISIDDLYEKKRQHDLNKLELFNKILNRIHNKIKTTSRQKIDEQFCWFVVPETIIGVPKYDQGACIAYLVDKLQTNGFAVRYVHPNTLFICWKQWVPSYVRSELKKKAGIEVDEYGNRKVEQDEDNKKEFNNMFSSQSSHGTREKSYNTTSKSSASMSNTPKREYKPIQNYKPTGTLIYNDKLLDELEDIDDKIRIHN